MAKSERLYIWDLDGTLIDSSSIVMGILAEVLPAHGYAAPTPEAIASNFHGSLVETIDGLIGKGEPEVAEAIMESFLTAQNKRYETVEHHLYPDALELVRLIRQTGARQVMVTNRDHVGRLLASPRSIVERSSLNGLIEQVFAGDDSEHRKPSPAVLGDFLEASGVRPEHITVIGDQFVDAQFAHNLGGTAIIVDRSGNGLVHADRLGDGWQERTTVVRSLDGLKLV